MNHLAAVLRLVAAGSLLLPVVAATIIIGVECPEGTNVVKLDSTQYPNFSDAFAAHGVNKTYMLGPRHYIVNQRIDLLDPAGTTCIIGQSPEGTILVGTGNLPNLGICYDCINVTAGALAMQYVVMSGFTFALDVVPLGSTPAYVTLSSVTFSQCMIGASLITSEVHEYKWSNVRFVDNTGNGLFLAGRTRLAITGSTFENNRATNNGAAVLLQDNAQLTLASSARFFNNTSGGYGAIFALDRAELIVLGPMEMINNTASHFGGALALVAASTAVLEGDTTMQGNTAGTEGGAIYVESAANLTVRGALCISHNTATGPVDEWSGGGGGILLRFSATVNFNGLPLAQVMAGNSPDDIKVFDSAHFTCDGGQRIGGSGSYNITGPVCECGNGTFTCGCPTGGTWSYDYCACRYPCQGGHCCMNGKMTKPAGTSCRPAKSSCDIPEVCPGDSADCPADTYLPDDQACVRYIPKSAMRLQKKKPKKVAHTVAGTTQPAPGANGVDVPAGSFSGGRPLLRGVQPAETFQDGPGGVLCVGVCHNRECLLSSAAIHNCSPVP